MKNQVEQIKRTLENVLNSKNQTPLMVTNTSRDAIDAACDGMPVAINEIDETTFLINQIRDKQKSAMSVINELLDGYERESLEIPFDVAYVRQIVSKYNTKYNVSFSVTENDGKTLVSLPFEQWKSYCEWEVDEYIEKVDATIGRMRGHVKVSTVEFEDDEIL